MCCILFLLPMLSPMQNPTFYPFHDFRLQHTVCNPLAQFSQHQSAQSGQLSIECPTPPLTTVDEELTVSSRSFVLFVSPTARHKNRGNPARETEGEGERWRQQKGMEGLAPFYHINQPIHTLKDICKILTKEASFKLLHKHNGLSGNIHKDV